MADKKTKEQVDAENVAIRKEAIDLGIDVAGKNMKQIKASLAKSKSTPPDGDEEALGGKAPGKNADIVDVIDGGGLIRSFSEAQHGKKFREHADEFASKVEGRKVVAHEEA